MCDYGKSTNHCAVFGLKAAKTLLLIVEEVLIRKMKCCTTLTKIILNYILVSKTEGLLGICILCLTPNILSALLRPDSLEWGYLRES